MRKGGLYVAMGDSVTWAVAGTAPTGATLGSHFYASRLRNTIRAGFGQCRLINKGLGGNTSTEMVTNIPWLTGVVPDLVTIGVGMNDCASQVVPVATFKTNLETLIDALRQRNPDVVIILCTPNRTTDANRTPYVADYRTAMAEVAADKVVALCDFGAAWQAADDGTYLVDGIHPNAAGHGKLHDVLWPVVQAAAASWLAGLQ